MLNHDADGPLGLYFEDFTPGMALRTRGRTITEADIVQFAALTGDFNPMHTDAEYMKDHPMGARIAHGMLSLSYAVGQLYQTGVLERTTLAFRALEMKFSLPVFIGDTLHAQITVTDTKAMPRLGGGVVTCELKIINQEGKAVQSGSVTLLMATRPAGS